MSEKVTVDDVDSGAYRALEMLLYVPVLLIAFFGIGLVSVGWMGVQSSSPLGVVFGGGIVVLYGAVLLSVLLFPVVLYVDATRIRASAAGWDPSPGFYALFGFLFSHLTALHYLWQRHNYVVDRVDSTAWVNLVVVCTLAPPVFFVAVPMGASAGVPDLLRGVSLAMTAVFAGLFPIAIYKDATYVRLRSGDWQPNPGTYLTLGLVLWLFAVISYPLTGAYYLIKRHRAIGIFE